MIEDEIQEQYVAWANTLDSAGVNSSKVVDRICLSTETVEGLGAAMHTAINASRAIDAYKKYLFYGKENEIEHYTTGQRAYTHGVADRMCDQETIRLMHSIMGLYDEAGELMQALFEHVYMGISLDDVNLKEEFGDTLWYLALACRYFRVDSLTFFMIGNYNKLSARYPEGTWTMGRALDRDKDAEREAVAEITDSQREALDKGSKWD
jgi:NTP pyrophosphatase (non-canonical NTP hydrolase)